MKIKNSLRQRSNLKEWPTDGKEEIVLKMSNSFWGSPQTACKIYTNFFTVKQDVPEKSSLSKVISFPIQFGLLEQAIFALPSDLKFAFLSGL